MRRVRPHLDRDEGRDMEFVSPSKGPLTFERMFDEIARFIAESSDEPYTLIVGSDSQAREREVAFVTAVVVHRVGKGARYFYQRRTHRPMASLRQKIFYEAALSLSLAGRLAERLSRSGYAHLNVEIHLDVGQNGDTR